MYKDESRSDDADALTQREVERIVVSALTAAKRRGRDGLTTDELQRVVDWARGARVAAVLLEKVLAGVIGAYPAEGDVMFVLLEDNL